MVTDVYRVRGLWKKLNVNFDISGGPTRLLEEPVSDTRGGAVIYHGPLGGSSGTAKSDLCDATSSSTTADNSDIGRHRRRGRKSTTSQLLQSDSLLPYAACKAAVIWCFFIGALRVWKPKVISVYQHKLNHSSHNRKGLHQLTEPHNLRWISVVLPGIFNVWSVINSLPMWTVKYSVVYGTRNILDCGQSNVLLAH